MAESRVQNQRPETRREERGFLLKARIVHEYPKKREARTRREAFETVRWGEISVNYLRDETKTPQNCWR